MLAAVNFAQLLFPDFSLILCGYLLCRYTALNRKVWEPVESLVYYFLFPVLLFHSIVRSPLDLGAASSLAAAGLALAAAAIALNYSMPWWPGLGKGLDRRLHAASAQVGFRFNSFIALALAERVAGPQGLQMVAVLIGLCVPIFNVGAVWPMYHQNTLKHPTTHRKGFAKELVRNPLILATGGGLLANLAGVHIPPWLEPTVTRIGGASLALGLMAAGAGMLMRNGIPAPASQPVPAVAAACPGVNLWKYGWAEAPGYARQLSPGAYEARYLQRDVIYLLGSADTNPQHPALDKSCAAEAQGPNRHARGHAYVDDLRQRHPGLAQRPFDVPGVGHDGDAMLGSACGQAALFDAPEAWARCKAP